MRLLLSESSLERNCDPKLLETLTSVKVLPNFIYWTISSLERKSASEIGNEVDVEGQPCACFADIY